MKIAWPTCARRQLRTLPSRGCPLGVSVAPGVVMDTDKVRDKVAAGGIGAEDAAEIGIATRELPDHAPT